MDAPSSMDTTIDELWKTIMQTCPILMGEWIGCFRCDEDAAKLEISRTLTNEDQWKDRTSNFLLRLVSDDKTGYRDASGNYKPRVQLALAIVRHMSTNSEFMRFVLATLNAHGGEGSCNDRCEVDENAGSSMDQPDLGIPLRNLGGSGDRRGNGILHEAAKSGTCTHLKELLSETNVDVRNNIGETALHLAAEFEHPKDVAILLRAGATIEVT